MHVAVIPAYNEKRSISGIVEEARKHVDYVVVVDDSSTDGTGDAARNSGAIVVENQKDRGVGAAIITGIDYVKKLRPRVVVILDGDGQHYPTDIPRLIEPIVKGTAELVLGSRFLRSTPSSMTSLKRQGNKFLTFVVSLLVGRKFTDTQTGFRAFSQRALLALNLRSRFTYTQEMILELCLRGYRCIEIPVRVRSRKYGNSKVASNIIRYAIKSLLIIVSTYLLVKTQK